MSIGETICCILSESKNHILRNLIFAFLHYLEMVDSNLNKESFESSSSYINY